MRGAARPAFLSATRLSTSFASASVPNTARRFSQQHPAPDDPVDVEQLKSAFSYCVQQVRNYDGDNYAWMVQLPKELRRPVFALRAFNIETALIGEHVQSKEAPLLQIRFQWWRDALDSLFFQGASFPKHPVLVALRAVLQQLQQSGAADRKGKINKYNLKKILDVREGDLLDPQPPLSIDGLEKYAEGTASQVLYLQLGAAGIASREADHAASHLGKAVGLATLLKGTSYHAHARRSYLPLDLCAEHGVSQEDVYSGNVSEGMRDVTHKVASVAKGHLDEARALCPKVPEAARHLMLSSVACHAYLKSLEKCGFDPFRTSTMKGGVSPLRHALELKWHLVFKSY